MKHVGAFGTASKSAQLRMDNLLPTPAVFFALFMHPIRVCMCVEATSGFGNLLFNVGNAFIRVTWQAAIKVFWLVSGYPQVCAASVRRHMRDGHFARTRPCSRLMIVCRYSFA
jgi:hypothetical protein